MILIEQEHITPQGGWTFLCPHCSLTFNHSVLHILKASVQEHYDLGKVEFSETEFRRNVCRNTPGAICTERTLAGDMVAFVAQPVAKVIDATAAAVGVQTNVSGCGGCTQRREKLNLWHEKLMGLGK